MSSWVWHVGLGQTLTLPEQQLEPVHDTDVSTGIELCAVGSFVLKTEGEEPVQQHLIARRGRELILVSSTSSFAVSVSMFEVWLVVREFLSPIAARGVGNFQFSFSNGLALILVLLVAETT